MIVYSTKGAFFARSVFRMESTRVTDTQKLRNKELVIVAMTAFWNNRDFARNISRIQLNLPAFLPMKEFFYSISWSKRSSSGFLSFIATTTNSKGPSFCIISWNTYQVSIKSQFTTTALPTRCSLAIKYPSYDKYLKLSSLDLSIKKPWLECSWNY
jgi:hypothetical protein